MPPTRKKSQEKLAEEECERNEEVFNKLVASFTPTEEDLQRQLSEDQLKLLCERVPCRVLMWRWNAVQDYVNRFNREGRLEHKTKSQAHALLAKAVNRHKAKAIYTDEQLQPVREEEWRYRKKDSLLRLDLWEYDEQAEKAANVVTDLEPQQEYSPIEILTSQSQELELMNMSDDISGLSMCGKVAAQEMPDSTSGSNNFNLAEEDETRQSQCSRPTNTQMENNMHITNNIDEVKDGDDNDNEETLPHSDVLNDLLVINTESIYCGTQSMEILNKSNLNLLPPTVENAVDYEEFNHRIPLTSTQSQSQSQNF